MSRRIDDRGDHLVISTPSGHFELWPDDERTYSVRAAYPVGGNRRCENYVGATLTVGGAPAFWPVGIMQLLQSHLNTARGVN